MQYVFLTPTVHLLPLCIKHVPYTRSAMINERTVLVVLHPVNHHTARMYVLHTVSFTCRCARLPAHALHHNTSAGIALHRDLLAVPDNGIGVQYPHERSGHNLPERVVHHHPVAVVVPCPVHHPKVRKQPLPCLEIHPALIGTHAVKDHNLYIGVVRHQ